MGYWQNESEVEKCMLFKVTLCDLGLIIFFIRTTMDLGDLH